MMYYFATCESFGSGMCRVTDDDDNIIWEGDSCEELAAFMETEWDVSGVEYFLIQEGLINEDDIVMYAGTYAC